MASIETRTRAGKIVHLVRYVDPDGKDRAPSFKTLREAKVFRAKIVTELHKGTYINRANGMTVAEYAWEYAKGRPHRPTSAEHTRSVLANHVQGTKLGGMKLVDVKPSDLQRWATERVTPDEDGHAPLAVSTARKTLSLLRSIFASAVEDKLIAMSPVTKRVRLPKVDKPRLSVLTVDEVKRLRLAMAGVRAQAEAMIEVQSRLGLRAGELLGLRDVDVNGAVGEVGEVKVTGQITGNSRVRVAPKTPKSRRILYLPPDVGQVLAEHVARWGVGDDGLLFVSERGGPYSAQGYGRLFGKAVAAAGIEQRNPGAWTSHDLRHHYASVMLANGLPPVAVAEWLGHDDGGVLVMSTYGHLMPSSEDKMREVQATAWA